MAGDFRRRVDLLLDEIGTGPLEGKVQVDQVYAKYQHERLDLKHPGGGGAKYLERPLYANIQGFVQRLADGVLKPDGLPQAMQANMEDLSEQVYRNAPFEFGDLRASGHPTVTSDGAVIYDRPPMIHRLSRDELRIKGHLHNLGLGN